MQSIVNSKEFFELRGIVDIFVNKVRTIEMDFNQNTREIYNLEKYEIIPEGNEEQVLGKYKEMYDKLAKIIIDKDKSITEGNESINQFESMVYYLQQLTSKNSFSSITYKEQKCVNELKDCVNAIVNKIEAKEREIFNKQSKKREKDFNKKLKQLEKMKFSKYEIQVLEPQVESEEKAEEELERIKELNSIKATVIDDSMDILKHWSNKTKYTILFDSSNDGDGSKNVLCNKVLNKSCLYFISFDDKGNVYGGYVPSAISSTSSWQQDKNSFLFFHYQEMVV
ncbi:TLDc domain-containing protein [Entamoeba marina]